MNTAALADAARRVLARNDRGGYSIPGGRLYPMQFNWDSAFAALGYAHCGDSARAWSELELLAAAQWPDGMIPHIIFRGDYQDYFPGPDIWRAASSNGGDIVADGENGVPTSGISNPPVAAFAVLKLRRQCARLDGARYKKLLTALVDWHCWLAKYGLDEQHDAFAAVHPWETGRDNLGDWDAAMARIKPRDHGAYERSDIKKVSPEQRPHQSEYDRFLEIVAVGREHKWRAPSFRRASPFRMLDPGITAIFAFANDCLIKLLEEENMTAQLRRVKDIGARARRGLEFLWNEKAGGYAAYDPELKQHSDGLSSAAFLAPLAGLFEGERHKRLMREFDRIVGAANYAMPSYDPAHEKFSPLRYWRGPVWLPVNLLIYEGLKQAGEHRRAETLAKSSLALTEKSGFYEYYHPQTGEGLGGQPFTWTAAATLHFLNDAGQL